MNSIADWWSVMATETIRAGIVALFALGLLALACQTAVRASATSTLARLRERVEDLRRRGWAASYRPGTRARRRRDRLTEVRQRLKSTGRMPVSPVDPFPSTTPLRTGAPRAGIGGWAHLGVLVALSLAAAAMTGFAAGAAGERREEWDTTGFRILVSLFKVILTLYVLAGAVLVTRYFLKKKQAQDGDPGGRERT